MSSGWVRPVGNGQTQVTVTVAGQTRHGAGSRAVAAGRAANQLPARGDARALTRGLQHGGLPRLFARQERLQTLAARLRSASPTIRRSPQESFGRRIDLLTPAASLLVAKPRGDIPHEGGVRFRRGSLSDDILVSWIRQGVPGDLGRHHARHGR